MSPEFEDLIGDEGTPEELDRLRQVHNMLVAAGPPPELSPRLADVPKTTDATTGRRAGWLPKRRKEVAFVVAAGVAAAAFGVGFLVGNRGSNEFPSNKTAIAMHAVASGPRTAHASIVLGERDGAGNWPMLVHVNGLKPLPSGQWYELYLTRKGKLAAYCGAFAVRSAGRTTVQLSVPYKLSRTRFDGWVVTTSQKGAEKQVLLTT
jgi:hypothetical protein